MVVEYHYFRKPPYDSGAAVFKESEWNTIDHIGNKKDYPTAFSLRRRCSGNCLQLNLKMDWTSTMKVLTQPIADF